MESAPRARVAVVGAGIYGSTTALHLAEHGHRVELFDPRGVLRASSATNQYRVHAGYHYPRSPETIAEVQSARGEFNDVFDEAIIRSSRHYYAIPFENSLTSPDEFEAVMDRYALPLARRRPAWMDFDFIDRCYEVAEEVYDPDILRTLISDRLRRSGVVVRQKIFDSKMRDEYDSVVFATYGTGESRRVFSIAKYQVAEKVLIELPSHLRGVSLVVVDGPFTAFDPFGMSQLSLFGSARYTNHWTSTDPQERVPPGLAKLLEAEEFTRTSITRFADMRDDAALAVPDAIDATYVGSRFALRVVEDSPSDDRRVLYVREGRPGEYHIFSGKVVSAVKAARTVAGMIG